MNVTGVGNAASSPTMTNIRVYAPGSGQESYGVINGNSSLLLQNAIVVAAGHYPHAVENLGSSSATLMDVSISYNDGSVSYGVVNSGWLAMTNVSIVGSSGPTSMAVTNMEGSTLTADRCTILVLNGQSISNSGTMRVGSSKLQGSINSSGTLTCAASYNQDAAPLGLDCK